ncbi:MAG: thermonuclease family protein [Geitlerinemataceae cyanobacterium]
MAKRNSRRWLTIAIAYGTWCAIATVFAIAPSEQPQPPSRTRSARVTRVVSGQTIEVEIDGSIETVRLSGLDAPDLRQAPWGLESQQALAREIEGREILLSWPEGRAAPPRDRFDRLWAQVWSADRQVALDRVRAGWGLTGDRALADAADFAAARAEARVLGRGIWNPERAMRQDPRLLRSER